MHTTNRWTPDQIKQLREAAGLTIDQMAVALGVKRTSYYKWETGERNPRPINIVRLDNFASQDFSNRSLQIIRERALELNLVEDELGAFLANLSDKTQEMIYGAILRGRS